MTVEKDHQVKLSCIHVLTPSWQSSKYAQGVIAGEEVKLLQDALMINFELQALCDRIHPKVPGQWVIVIPTRQVKPLKDIVCTFIHYSPKDWLIKLFF